MSWEYAISRVRDAIEKCDGNHQKARRMILGWAEKDQSLILGLIEPHIEGAIAYALKYADKKDTPKIVKPAAKSQAAKPSTRKTSTRDEDIGELGAAILSSMKQGSTARGMFDDTPAAPQRKSTVGAPPKASKTHIDAINTLAAASKKKRGED